MGGGASLQESSKNLEQEQYLESLIGSGINISDAVQNYREKFEDQKSSSSLKKNKNLSRDNDMSEKSIHFIAMRQLSQNLTNFKESADLSTGSTTNTSQKFNINRIKELDKKSSRNLMPPLTNNNSTRNIPLRENSIRNLLMRNHDMSTSRSNLSIPKHSHNINNEIIGKISEDVDEVYLPGSSLVDDDLSPSSIENKAPAPLLNRKPTLFVRVQDNTIDSNDQNTMTTKESPHTGLLSNDLAKISPRGSLHIGQWRIHENGMMSSDSLHKTDNSDTKVNEGILEGGSNQFIEIGPLGSGASGVVMEALHIPTLTIVALKMLPVYNTQKRQNVSRELQILYKNLTNLRLINESLHMEEIALRNYESLQSEHSSDFTSNCVNVLSLYNAFIDPKSGMINLVIEYMDGGSLQDLVNRGGCQDEDILADIAIQTLSGLKFLHHNNNIHRDIKPANILTSTKGIVKIADFGISKALDSNGVASSFVGTVCYMSPERITGGTYSYSCDIWSFGLTMLAVAEGKFPLESGDNHSVKGGYWGMIKAICDDNPPQPDKKFSKEFSTFIGHCLQKNVEKRSTAIELLTFPFITNWQKKFEVFDENISDNQRLTLNTIVEDENHFHLNNPSNGSSTNPLSQVPSPRPKRLSSISMSGSERQTNQVGTMSHKKPSSTKIVYPTPLRNPVSDAEADAVRVRHLEKVLDRLQCYIEDEYLSTTYTDQPQDVDTQEMIDYLSSSGKVVSLGSGTITSSTTKLSSKSTKILSNNKNINLIPKLEGNDLKYWRNLSEQLHLPFSVVKVAAKNAFGKYI